MDSRRGSPGLEWAAGAGLLQFSWVEGSAAVRTAVEAAQVTGRIPESCITEIRDRTDIVEVISRHVELKRSGANFKGLCPFHEEKTPSFNVNPARQFFHCFGCQASGDVIGFLMRLEGRSFVEVVEDLAQHAGVDVPRDKAPGAARAAAAKRSERQGILDLNARAATFFRRCFDLPLAGPARTYLADRGIGDEVCERFMLGFAPPSGGTLAGTLKDNAIDLEAASLAGLVAKRTGRDGYHDRFWNRLMCPVVGPGGEVQGFSGRVLGDASGGPKYVNTPETPVFRKGDTLYGTHQAMSAIRKAGVVLLVEGNFDVLQMHQHGFTHTVAPLGTAMTPQQVRLLKRFCQQVVAIFDGDEAGRAAGRRAAKTLLDGGMEAKIAALPSGADPDSLLRDGGQEAMQRVIDRALPVVDFLIADQRSQIEDSIPGRARLVESVAPAIALLPSSTTQALYVDRLSMELGIDRAIVQRAVAAAGRGDPGKGSAPRSARPAGSEGDAHRPAAPKPVPVGRGELELLKLLVEHPRLMSRAERADLARLLTHEGVREVYGVMLAMQERSGEVDAVELLRVAPSQLRDAVAEAASARDYAKDGDPTRALDDCVASLAEGRVVEMVRLIKDEIRRGQRDGAGTEGKTAASIKRLDVLTKIQMKLRKARERHEAEDVWSLVPELVEAEREIHDTQ